MKGEGDSEGESDLEGEGDSEGDGDPEGDGDLEGEGDSECEVGDAIAFDWTLLLWGSFCAGAGATGVLFGQKVISRFTLSSWQATCTWLSSELWNAVLQSGAVQMAP